MAGNFPDGVTQADVDRHAPDGLYDADAPGPLTDSGLRTPHSALVSAICPTRNRRKYLPGAIRCFLAQAWPEKELVIVNDGLPDSGEPVGDLIPDGAPIRLVDLPVGEALTIGAKRNIACEMARGEIIMHWDDDDWSAPGRMGYQVGRLSTSGKPVTGFHSLLFWDETQSAAVKYHGSAYYAVGTSLCYLREWWKAHPFPAKNVGEDNDLVYPAAQRGELDAVDGGQWLVARIHAGCTSPKTVHGGQANYMPIIRDAIPPEFFQRTNR